MSLPEYKLSIVLQIVLIPVFLIQLYIFMTVHSLWFRTKIVLKYSDISSNFCLVLKLKVVLFNNRMHSFDENLNYFISHWLKN